MKAKPIPDSIETLPSGTQVATCAYEGGPIFRSHSPNQTLPWIHMTGRIICGEEKPK